MDSAFNPHHQITSIESKIIASLERIAQVFRVMLWQQGKEEAISPIGVQILIFLYFHHPPHRTISYLAKEFTMTKATISDSVRVLEEKGLLVKEADPADARSYTLQLTESGKCIAQKASFFADGLKIPLQELSPQQKEVLYQSLLQMINTLNQAGIIQANRMCYTCRFHTQTDEGNYCALMNKNLKGFELQIDCLEHIAK